MIIGISELKSRPNEILRQVQESGSAVLVTRHEKPVALILPAGSPEAEDYILAHAPDIVTSLREAEALLRAGLSKTLKSYRRPRGL